MRKNFILAAHGETTKKEKGLEILFKSLLCKDRELNGFTEVVLITHYIINSYVYIFQGITNIKMQQPKEL